MLNKYVFNTEVEINGIIEEDEKIRKGKTEFYQSRIEEGMSMPEIDEEFQLKEVVEWLSNLSNDDDKSNTPTDDGYYSKM